MYCVRLSTSVPHFPTNNELLLKVINKTMLGNCILETSNMLLSLELRGSFYFYFFSISRSKIATEMSELLLGHKL